MSLGTWGRVVGRRRFDRRLKPAKNARQLQRYLRIEPLENRVLLAASVTNADLIYDSQTGNVRLDAAESAGQIIVNFVLTNDSSQFSSVSNPFPEELAGSVRAETSISTASEISWTDTEVFDSGAIWTNHPGSGQALDLGVVFPTGMDESQLATFLNQATYVGEPGTGVQTFDLIMPLPFPWHNADNPFDINGDTLVTPVGDVLPLINELNSPQLIDQFNQLPVPPTTQDAPPPFYDVNRDNQLTPAQDVLPVINELNNPSTPEGEFSLESHSLTALLPSDISGSTSEYSSDHDPIGDVFGQVGGPLTDKATLADPLGDPTQVNLQDRHLDDLDRIFADEPTWLRFLDSAPSTI